MDPELAEKIYELDRWGGGEGGVGGSGGGRGVGCFGWGSRGRRVARGGDIGGVCGGGGGVR